MERIQAMRRMIGAPQKPMAVISARGWDIDLMEFQLESLSDDLVGGTLRRLSTEFGHSSFLVLRALDAGAPKTTSGVPEVPPLSRVTVPRVHDLLKDIHVSLSEPMIIDLQEALIRLRCFLAGAQAHLHPINMNTLEVQRAMRLQDYLSSFLRGGAAAMGQDGPRVGSPKREFQDETEPPYKKSRGDQTVMATPPSKKARREAPTYRTEEKLYSALILAVGRHLPNLLREPIPHVLEGRKRILAAALIGAEIHESFWPLLAEIEELLAYVNAQRQKPGFYRALTEGAAAQVRAVRFPSKIAIVGSLPDGMLLEEARQRLAVLLPQMANIEIFGEQHHHGFGHFSAQDHWVYRLPNDIENPQLVDMIRVIAGVLNTTLS